MHQERRDTACRVPTLRGQLILGETPIQPVDLILTLLTPTGYVVHETRVPLAAPARPRITAIEPGQKSVRVHFNPVPGAEEYQVSYTAPGQTTPTETKSTIDTQITVPNLTPGTPYQFTVVALNGTTSASTPVEASPNGQPLPPLITKAVPLDGMCSLGYAVEPGDQSFDIEYSTQPNQFTRSLSNLTVKGAAQIPGLRNGTTYSTRLRRHGDTGTSNWSTPITISPNGHQPPPVPVLRGAVRGPDLISLRFEPSEQATAYRIRYSNGSKAVTIPLDAAAVTHAILTGMNDSRPYTISMAAVGAGGISAFSPPIAVDQR